MVASSTISLLIPSSLSSILAEYKDSVFAKRPSSLIPTLPLVLSSSDSSPINANNDETQATSAVVVGEAVIDLYHNKSSFVITTVRILFPAFHISVMMSSPNEDKNNNTNQTKADSRNSCNPLLRKWLEPRTEFHLPLPTTAFGFNNNNFHSSSFIILHLPHQLQLDESQLPSLSNKKLKNVSDSLKTWCSELHNAIDAGKRFAPILRSQWSWMKESEIYNINFRLNVINNNHNDQIVFHQQKSGENNDDDEQKETRMSSSSSSSQITMNNFLTIPLGTVCACSVAAKTSELRTDGLPFDWILSPSLSGSLNLVSKIFGTSNPTASSDLFHSIFSPEVNKENAIPCTHKNHTNRYFSVTTTKAKEESNEEERREDENEETAPTYVCNKEYSLIASITEASRFGRRCERLRDEFWTRLLLLVAKDNNDENENHTTTATNTCCISFIYIGKPFRANENFLLDDENIVKGDHRHDNKEGEESCWSVVDDDFARTARMIKGLKSVVQQIKRNGEKLEQEGNDHRHDQRALTIFFFAFNETSKSFVHVLDDDDEDSNNNENCSGTTIKIKVIIIHQFVGFPSEGTASSWDSIGFVCGRKLPPKSLLKNVHQHEDRNV